jgi:glutamate synthase (NADPH/NADH) large chain
MTGGRVIVLGPTGRNFGAGMSGGIAYVYDRANDFDRKVNGEMVEIEQLDAADREFLETHIERHLAETDSAVAKRLLVAWSVESSKFRKVMPVDYKRVLTVMAQAEADGLDEQQTTERVMEAARG